MKKRFRVLSALAYNDPLYHQGVTQFAHEAEWELDMTVAYYGSEPVHWKGDGIITHYLASRPGLMKWVRRQHVPVVSINADEVAFWPGTAPDHEQCGRMAADYFFALGITELAFFRCSDQVSIQGRQRSFQEAVARRGGTFHLLDWRETTVEGRSTARLANMIAGLPVPLGIFCQSDHRAAALFNACEAAGRGVPEEIAILGVGNNETLCEFSRVPLSSVDTDMKAIAREGAAMLDRMMRGESSPKTPILFPPIGLVSRKSTAVVRAAHPQVAEALYFIVTHFAHPINATDVIRHIGASRDWLSRLFRKHVGRSISEELLRVRIEQAKYLLLSTDKKIAEIAKETGFTSYVHFAKSFLRAVGSPATEFVAAHRGHR
ncbi:MAG TPA: hypothetical protein DEB39_01360 [Planctomycetaceae bacterium]|nr:hypothetical protein [Planctomycetaceae bacterium]